MENNLILLIVLVVALSQIALVVYYVLLGKHGQDKQTSLESQEKNWDIMHDAIKKSQAIVGNAELEAIKQAAVSGQETQKLEKAYEKEMDMSVEEVLMTIKSETARAGEAYKQELSKQTELIKALSNDVTKETLAEIKGQLEKNMHEIQDGFVKELAVYKTQKEKLLDQNAEEIIERAAELYLGKKLSKEQHMQLVFDALEQAKLEKKFQ